MSDVTIIGGGLAGSEAAWYLLNKGLKVELYEMRPKVMTPAHSTGLFAELVCSNSLRSEGISNSAGLLKKEMEILGSIVMESGKKARIPAGGALAVDRIKFAAYITSILESHPNLKVIREEAVDIPKDKTVIIASGPLTSDKLSESIKEYTDDDGLYFYDAAAPIISKESINMDKVFWGSRYDKGDRDYINCPMDKEQYIEFWNNLINAKTHPTKEFEEKKLFEGCMPIEEMASRGIDTLRFGPLKPVGLINHKTGEQPYAVVQLRQDNIEGTMFNLVGFQTNLKWSEQKRVFSMIPGLENLEILRYGVMHRNTYINSPKSLKATLQSKKDDSKFFAGQLTGVEGYIESAASGIVAGINCYRLLNNQETIEFPKDTGIGSLCHYITTASPENFQPMHINFGLLPLPDKKIKNKKERREYQSNKSLASLINFVKTIVI